MDVAFPKPESQKGLCGLEVRSLRESLHWSITDSRVVAYTVDI